MAAANGLIIGEGLLSDRVPAADEGIVHRALAGGRDQLRGSLSHSPEEDIHDPLGGFHVAAGDRGGVDGVDHAPFRGDHLDRGQAAGVVGDIHPQQAAENVIHGREGNGVNGVDAACLLGGAAGEIHEGLVTLDRYH